MKKTIRGVIAVMMICAILCAFPPGIRASNLDSDGITGGAVPDDGTGTGNDGSDVTNASVSLSESTLQINPGASTRLRASSGVDGRYISWSVADSDVAQLSARTGDTVVITGRNPGRTTVTARVGDGTPATCQITISGITLSKTTLEMGPNTGDILSMSRYGDAENLDASYWDWTSSNTGVVIVMKQDTGLGATVQAVSSGTAVITCSGGGYTAMCSVTVAPNEASIIHAKVTDGVLKLEEIITRLQSLCISMTDENLSYITSLAVDTSEGILFDGYASEGDTGLGVASARKYYVRGANAYQVANITFMPKIVDGIVDISYTGYSINEKAFTGTIQVEVTNNQATLSYASYNGQPVKFQSDDFASYYFTATNRSLQSVTFGRINSRYGTLYYNYINPEIYNSVVDSGTRYYRTYTPSINNISFVPASDYAGTFTAQFTAYDTEGNDYEGILRITVNNPNGRNLSGSGSSRNGRLDYETGPGGRVSFKLEDFEDECYDETGRQLESIRFNSLPSSSRGTVYYNRTREVETGEEYYRSGSTRNISNLSFEADEDYTGSFYINFTGTDTRDRTFTSRIYITVTENGAYAIQYSVSGGDRVWFSASDFNDACLDATDRNLDYIRFTDGQPPLGTLSYGENINISVNNISVQTAGALVTSSETYYYNRSSGAAINDILYTAPVNYSGTIEIPFTGYNIRGNSFRSHVSIRVSYGSGNNNYNNNYNYYNNGALSYQNGVYATSGPAIAIRPSDIISAASQTLSEIAGVTLLPPDVDSGQLLSDYTSPGSYGAFDSARVYLPQELSNVYFLPAPGFQGTAVIRYTARDRLNKVYSSAIRVQVTPPMVSRYFTDLAGRSWAVPAVDFFKYYNIINGVTDTIYDPDDAARRGAFITVLSRMYNFPGAIGNGGFWDVNPNRYYAGSIASARAAGILDSAQYFYPDAAVSRQDAAVWLYRSLRRAGKITSPGAYSDLIRFTDMYSVAPYAVEAMGALARAGVFTGDSAGRLNPSGTLTRLQMAAILYRAVMP